MMACGSYVTSEANALRTSGEPCVLGIDEAGRGAVLGPMTYACAMCRVADKDRLKGLGFADSKTLTGARRDELFDTIQKNADWISWEVHVISADDISQSSYQKGKYSLNDLSQDSAASLVARALAAGMNITHLYVDTVGPPETYKARLASRFPTMDITVESKADGRYPVTGAASICAKVHRDRLTEGLESVEEGLVVTREFGCGYPGDAVTKKWLRDNNNRVFGFNKMVRFSWSTAKTILKENEFLEVDFGDSSDDDDDEQAGERIRPDSFFQPTRQRFFEERRIDLVTGF